MNRNSNILVKLLDKCSNFLFGVILLIIVVGVLFLLHESESIEILCSGDGCKVMRDHRGKCFNARMSPVECDRALDDSNNSFK